MSDYTDTSFWDDFDVQWDIPNFVVANNGVLYVMPKYPEEFNDHGVIAFSHPSFCPGNGYGVKHRRSEVGTAQQHSLNVFGCK